MYSGVITKIQVVTDSVATTVLAGSLPTQLGVSPDGQYIFASDRMSDQVIVLGADDRIVKRISVGRFPTGVSFSPGGEFAYIANSGSDDVSVVDLQTLQEVKRIPVGKGPHGIAASYPYPTARGSVPR